MTPYYYMQHENGQIVFVSGRTYQGQPRKFIATSGGSALADFQSFCSAYYLEDGACLHEKIRIINDLGGVSREIEIPLASHPEGVANRIHSHPVFC